MKKILYIITGTSGAGKTTVIPELRKRLQGFAIYDGDSVAGDNYKQIKCNWLSIAKSNLESGIYTVICSTILPENLEDCYFLEYFEEIRYINLHINEELIRQRLTDRNWNKELIEEYVHFSNWLVNNKDKAFTIPLHVINSSNLSIEETAIKIEAYIVETIK